MVGSEGDPGPPPATTVAIDARQLGRPIRLLVYLLIALALVELYQQASYLVLKLTNIVLIFMFAAVIAMLVTPLIDRLERLPLLRGRRALAVLTLYGLAIIVLGGLGAAFAPTVLRDAGLFGAQIPAFIDQAQHLLDQAQGSLRGLGLNLSFRIPRSGAPIGGDISTASLTQIGGLVSPVVNVLLVVVISLYFTVQGRLLVASGRKLFPKQERAFDFTVLAIGAAVAAYVRAQLLMSLLMAAYTGITLTLIGVRYGIALGVAVFFLELLPLVGAPIGFALAILVALTQSVQLGIEATVVSLIGHAIEAYILGPRISGKVTRIHPLVAMGALLVGAELAGVLGALFAIPVAVIGNIFLGVLYVRSQGREGLVVADTPGPVAVSDLPSLADQIGVGSDEAPAVLGAQLVKPPPKTPVEGTARKADPTARPARAARAARAAKLQ